MSSSPSIGPASPDPLPGARPDGPNGGDAPPPNGSTPRALLRPGMQLNGIFEIDAHLASGGMGEVYKGHSIQTGDQVAIKVIRAEFVEDETAISLFRKEAAALFHLHHEAIVRYFVFSIDPSSQRAYLAMEFVEGELLSEVLKRGPMPMEDVCLLAERIALGLHAAHQRDIIHRDVTPDNIIIPNGDVREAKIIDFGIAGSTRAGTETSVEVGFAGKYKYVAPEQLGLYGGEVTVKSDIYSLGLVLLEALNGGRTDMGATPVAATEKRKRLPDLDLVDARIRPLLKKMLEPNPADRPKSMQEAAAFFRRLPRSRLSLGVRSAIGVVAMLALIGSGVFAYLWRAPPATPVRPTENDAQQLPAEASGKGTGAPRSDLAQQAARPIETTSARDRLVQSIESFAGGPCFSITSVGADGSATIEGIGASREPFDRLDDAVKAANGFEAQIHVRLITPAQCAALAFFNRFKTDLERSPHLDVGSSILRGGQPLKGTISNVGDRQVEALLIDDDGVVQNVTGSLQTGDAHAFTLSLERPKGGQRPRLLLAVTSAQPLSSMKPATPLNAESFFPAVQSEAAAKQERLGVALQYFKVE